MTPAPELAGSGHEFVGGKKVALLPNATLLAQAWDEAAAERVGEMLASEGRSQDVDVVLGPTVNLHRSGLARGSAGAPGTIAPLSRCAAMTVWR